MSYDSLVDTDFDEMTEVQRQILEVSDADVQVLTFWIGEDMYCVDIEPVSEVLWNEHSMAEVPDMADHVVGVANLRGRSVDVIDPRLVLGKETTEESENIILFEENDGEGRGFAWLATAVDQVLSISNDEIDDTVTEDKVKGIIERDGNLIMWVSPDCFSSAIDTTALDDEATGD